MDNMGESWKKLAACKDHPNPEIFFPEKGYCSNGKDAKEICKSCVVRVECLDFALRNFERFGIWGGMNLKERQAYKRKLRKREKVNNA